MNKEKLHLNIPEGLDRLSIFRGLIKDLRYQVWLRDIMSSTVPEYIEHHESIQEILSFIDDILEWIDKEEVNDAGL